MDDAGTSDAMKQKDRLWKVRSLTEKVCNDCLLIPRQANVCIDKQTIPFTGSTSLKQYVPNNRSRVSLPSPTIHKFEAKHLPHMMD